MCVIMPKRLKMICSEVDHNNTSIVLEKWGRFYADGGKTKMLGCHFLRCDK